MLKQFFSLAFVAVILASCGGTSKITQTAETPNQPINVNIDLINVLNDKVSVKVNPGSFDTETVSFYIPQTVPGTYSNDDYGRLIENLNAFDYANNPLSVNKIGDNQWEISNATKFDYLTYQVNDSYDIEGELEIFSPSGTNIEKGENFVLNLHGFVGYFDDRTELPYSINITRPRDMFVSTALSQITTVANATDINEESSMTDNFDASRYFEVTDSPIMYTETQPSEFMIEDMKVVLDVYSPTELFSAEKLQPNLEKMMQAQKNYLGEINDTPLYAIMLYLSKANGNDAKGFGALEHHTSTVVVFPEAIPQDYLDEMMTDVVSHEFFHTLTPLNVHSHEIHYFDYNNPEMSQHLWMYEGVTEYFANHFQVYEGLITPEDFYGRMMGKIVASRAYTDDMPFTEMSANVLKAPYEDEYINVYQKGALIAMCLDIRLRELSNGETGILQMMGELSKLYGKDKPFDDDKLIPTIVEITYPEIQDFFDTYVTGSTPIPYGKFFAKVGLQYGKQEIPTNMFFMMDQQIPFIDVNETTKEILYSEGLPTNSMVEKLGIKTGDVVQSVNGTDYNLDNLRTLILSSTQWQLGQELTMVVLRDDEPVTLKATYEVPTYQEETLTAIDLPETDSRVKLRNAWLFGKE